MEYSRESGESKTFSGPTREWNPDHEDMTLKVWQVGVRFHLVERWIVLVALVAVWGCGNSSSPSTQPTSITAKPSTDSTKASSALMSEADMFDQFHSGMVQLESAGDSIEEALQQAQSLKTGLNHEEKQAVADAIELIDSAGSGVTEAYVDPPTAEEFQKQYAHFDDLRLKAIDDSNDALHDLVSALGIVDDAWDAAKGPVKQSFEKLSKLLSIATGDLEDAIKGLGGKVIDPEN